MLPSESTTCQCGSGVSGTTKSSDSVRKPLPSLMLCVTVPLLAFGPWNCEEVCEPLCAATLETLTPRTVTTRATNITFRMRDIFIYVPLLLVFATTFRTEFESQTIHGARLQITAPISYPKSSPCSDGIPRCAECFRTQLEKRALQRCDFFAARESDRV